MAEPNRPLIDALAAELAPTRWWQRPTGLALIWLVAAVLFTVSSTAVIEPWRVTWLTQLTTVPRFALEIALASLGFLTLGWAALQAAVPGARRSSVFLLVAVLAWAPWLLLLLYGHEHPALEPSMLGKREACELEVMILSQPIMLLGLLFARRIHLLRGWLTGALLGLASGMVVAIVMQLACMYIVDHIWTHHIAPVLVPMATGLVGGVLLKNR